MKLISKREFDRCQEMQKAIPVLEQQLAMMTKPPKEKTVYLQHETFDIQSQRYIDEMNMIGKSPWYELVCLCWGSGQRTPIHDHEGSSCAFLVVEGDATETRFEHTPSGLVVPVETNVRNPGFVCASSEADIHQVANTQPEGCDLITLHIYSPQLRHFNVYSMDTPTACDPNTVRCHADLKVSKLSSNGG